MEEQPKSIWWKFWGRPLRFFAWSTLLSALAWLGSSFILDKVHREPSWSSLNTVSIILVFFVVFIFSIAGLILSLIPPARPWASWILRRWFFCLAALTTLIALFYAEENWRGQRALGRAKQELVARRVELDWDKFIPPPEPADQNVFDAPNMQEWFVGRGSNELTGLFQSQTNFPVWSDKRKIETETEARSYLAWSDQFQPQFTMIRDALKRPYSRMGGDYSNIETLPIPNFIAIRNLSRILAQRTHCYLLVHQPGEAIAEMAFIHDLSHFTDAKPTGKPMTLVAAMINVAVVGLYTDVVGEGLRTRSWQEPQLVELQRELSEIHVMIPVANAFETEPAASTRAVEMAPTVKLSRAFEQHADLFNIAPRGWILQNIANEVPFFYSQSDAFDVPQERVKPSVLKESQKRLKQFIAHKSPFRVFAATLLPNIGKASEVTAHNQNSANEALIACALERYRIANGSYPDSLAALVPKFIDKIPHDVVTGEVMPYRREASSFVLYSIGWNEKDDGGMIPTTLVNGKPDPETGDWVWPFSPK